MESRITTYLFYMGLLFSLVTMVFCTLVFHKNLENQTHTMLKNCCETIVENTNDKDINLPKTVNYKITDIDSDDIKNDIKNNGFAKGKVKTDSIHTDIFYYILFKDTSYVITYTEMDTIYDTAAAALPYLIAIFFAVIFFSALFTILLTDKFMKPIHHITADDFDFKASKNDSEIYEELLPILNVKTKAEKMKRQFTANVSHELKTPLTSILGYAQLIESQIAKGDDVVKFASVINKESQRMLYLVGDILKLSELEEENANITMQDTDLFEVSKTAIEALEVIAKKNNVTLTLNGESTVINANKNLIYELIYNLCDNAIRYNKPEGIVSVTTKNNTLTVTDTGIGIDKKYHSRIFERFYRVDKSRSKQTGGTGLGLSIVKHITELHNGEISIESEIGKGTKIEIIFN